VHQADNSPEAAVRHIPAGAPRIQAVAVQPPVAVVPSLPAVAALHIQAVGPRIQAEAAADIHMRAGVEVVEFRRPAVAPHMRVAAHPGPVAVLVDI